MIRRLRLARDDSGFTLVELIVYSILLILVIGIAGGIFINLLRGQQDVLDYSDANESGQLAFKQLERDLRNAAIVVTDNSGKLLVLDTRVATSADDDVWVCVGYFLDTAGETLRRVASADGSGTTAVALAKSSDAEVETASASWTARYEGFQAVPGQRAFGVTDNKYTYPTIPGIPVALAMDTGNGHEPIEFAKTISLRPQDHSNGSCV
ncbi:hypothetical protein [Demequina sp.]|uniref:PilW family protein n=1 Tax=Demequina sp. TaxID=2050685 RepID=UPI0025FADADB|nr:hypothetical protein [Demequina sp.]